MQRNYRFWKDIGDVYNFLIMSSNWINVTPKLEAGLALINALEPAKLRLLLNRIVAYMQQNFKGESKTRMFTEEEEIKLQKSLNLESEDVQLVIDTSFLILQQAAFHIMKPELLHSKLVDGLRLEQERASMIASLWSTNAGSIIENLRHQSVLPNQLADLSWMVMVETSSDIVHRKKEPVALLELLLKSAVDECDSKVQIKMSQDELQHLYQKLESVQSQLDSLK